MSERTSPTVTTTAGEIRGVDAGDHLRFLGVPYARAPFGPHRFGAPRPVERWDGVRDAVEYAPTAPQPEQGFTIIPEPTIDGGDAPACLSLNVFTPDLGAAGLPVLVWIHGGGFVTGTPSSPWYDGRAFARSGIVVVSVGYRLGAEGFLTIPDAPSNRGVRDWLAALEWVHDNIAAFGGDPGQVTIGGQSAGGVAVTTLLAVPAARGSFHRAIAMSGSIMPMPSVERTAAIAEAVASHLDVPCTIEGLASRSHADLVTAQGTVQASELPGSSGGAVAGRMLFVPVVDGDLVPGTPAEALAAGATDDVDLLVGATAEEMNLLSAGLEVDDDALVAMLQSLGLEEAAARDCVDASDTANGLTYGQAVTDSSFRVPGTVVADLRAAGAGRTHHYDFRFGAGLGAIHCIDVPFAWGLLDAEAVDVVAGEEPPTALGEAVHRAWADFVTTGDPGWAPWHPDEPTTMVFDLPDGTAVVDALAVERSRWAGQVAGRIGGRSDVRS